METLSGGRGEPGGGRRVSRAVLAVVAVVAVGAAAWLLLRPHEVESPEVAPTTRPARPPAARPSEARAAAGIVEVSAPDDATVSVDGRRLGQGPQRAELEAGPHRVRVEQPGRDVYAREVHVVPGRTLKLEARLEAEAPRLRVAADVPGAQVFVDREFVGEAPVVVRDVAPGPHRLNVSAEGYEMHTETIDVRPGSNEVTVRFKEVRLDERLAVTHKHGLGSCRGQIVATAEGLRYETDNAKDAFSLPFSAAEPLEVDYLKKNLRVKQRGGRTWNFTAESADALLVFRKAVEKVRSRLR